MTVNKTLLIVGIVLALAGMALVFVLNLLFAPPTDFIMAARQDIPAGTALSELGDDAFVQIPVQFANRSARLMLDGVAQPADLAALRAAGAVVIQDIYKYQPITLGSIVSADNPAAARVARLGLDDPDMIVIAIPGSTETIPDGVQPGDRIDLAVAVTDVADLLSLEGDEEEGMISVGSTLTGVPNEALAALLAEAGYVVTAPGGTTPEGAERTPTPEPTPAAPMMREPVVKLLVRGAVVVAVRRDTTVAGVTQQGQATIIEGEITGLDVVIPREAFEFVTMALNGGNLQIALLSPLVAESSEGPTIGASLQDLLDLFVSDREALGAP